MSIFMSTTLIDFNPRSLTGATVMVIQDWHNAIVISIHAPLQERLRTGFPHRLHCYFNPRSLAGATVKLPLLSMRKANFNPRSLTGATGSSSRSTQTDAISIHAPSRERQVLIQYLRGDINISIHAPSRERPVFLSAVIGQFDFNPRSLTGATPV